MTEEKREIEGFLLTEDGKAHCVNIVEHIFAGFEPDGCRIVLTGVDY